MQMKMAYQDYIDANPDCLVPPATLAEVQAMITAVNTAHASILAQIEMKVISQIQ